MKHKQTEQNRFKILCLYFAANE